MSRKPHILTCACWNPGWTDAGCVFHGIVSSLGLWDGEKHFEEMRQAGLPDLTMRRRTNVRWD